jgi:aryl-alcohol dehydrogenase-like predicted oxidoreductase
MTRRLGRTGWSVSPVGLGTYCLTSDWGVSRGDALAVLRRAIALGVDLVDTAPLYGSGDAEQLIGEALQKRQHRYRLIDKVGRFDQGIFRRRAVEAYVTPALIRAQVEHSLRILGRGDIDLLLVHEADDLRWWSSLDPLDGPVLDALDDLRRDGLVERIGISSREVEMTARLLDSGRFDVLLYVHYLNAVWQEAGDILLPLAAKHDTGVIVGAPFRRGVLLRADPDHLVELTSARCADTPPGMIERLRRLGDLADGAGMSIGELGLRYLLSLNGIASVLVGTEKVDQLEQNLRWASAGPLPDDLLHAVGEVRSVPPGDWDE